MKNSTRVQRGVAYFANDNLLQNVETGEQVMYREKCL